MLSSDYADTVRLGGYEASSSNEVDAVGAASSSPPTSRCVSPYPPAAGAPATAAALNGVTAHLEGAARSCERRSSSSHTRPTSPWLDRHSASSTSFDADDEADAQSPSDATEQAIAPPLSATVTLEYAAHPAVEASSDTAADALSLVSPAATEVAAAAASCSGVHRCGCAAGLPPLARHRAVRRSTPQAEAGSSDTSSPTSPMVPFATKAASSAAAAAGPSAADVAGRPKTLASASAAARAVTSPHQQTLPRDVRDDESADAAERSAAASPPAHPPSSLPPSLAASTTSALTSFKPLSGAAAAAAAAAMPPSPLGSRLRLPSASATELQEYGCCVFFFPAPFVSWLFPFVGHVAISNAEGSRLYTFESSYYVREEKLVAVLDRVLRAEAQEPRTASVLRNAAHLASPSDAGGALHVASPLRSPSSSQQPGRSAMSDGSGSDAAMTSPSDTGAASPFRHSVTAPVFPSRSSARPPRRTGRSRSTGAAATSGHAHTPCVRIWDLKPLLMESRGRRTRRTPYGFTTQGGKQAAAALWERLQGFLQPAEAAPAASANTGSSSGTRATAPRSPVSAMKRRSNSDYNSDDADGAAAAAAAGMSSSSSSGAEDEDAYELLDAETARFYNRNLHATIRLFRGSADGSINSPDVVLQHHSSFSFVGFVLEACGIGSQARQRPATAAAAAAPAAAASSKSPAMMPLNGYARAAATGAGLSSGPPAATSTESTESEDEIRWGVAKLLFHVSVFGKWHRGERRLWRVTHGGSISSATILWIAILSITVYYLQLLFSAYATKEV